MTKLHDIGEDRLIELLAERLGASGVESSLGLKDDVALIGDLAGSRTIVSMDTMVEGTHFRWWPGLTPADLGYKLAMTNLSDLAAKGATPTAMMLSLGMPQETTLEEAEAFFDGLGDALAGYSPGLIGGDTVRSPVWTATLWVAGALQLDRFMPRRRNARPGMNLFVTGQPGEAAAGFEVLEENKGRKKHAGLVQRFIRPEARLDWARTLVRVIEEPFAMLDVSDGVAKDAMRIARASKVGIELEQSALPVSKDLATFAKEKSRKAEELVLFGGEDFELLLAAPLAEDELHERLGDSGVVVTQIGEVVAGGGVAIRGKRGKAKKIESGFFEHF